MVFKNTTHLRPRSVEQHPLISLGNCKDVTHFFGSPTVDVPHRENDPLYLWQGLDTTVQDSHGFTSQQLLLRVDVPWPWCHGPMIRKIVVGRSEPQWIHYGLRAPGFSFCKLGKRNH